MSNRSQIITTQEMYLTAQKNKHMLNVELLLDKPVGVAEHPDIMETIELELGKMATEAPRKEVLSRCKARRR